MNAERAGGLGLSRKSGLFFFVFHSGRWVPACNGFIRVFASSLRAGTAAQIVLPFHWVSGGSRSSSRGVVGTEGRDPGRALRWRKNRLRARIKTKSSLFFNYYFVFFQSNWPFSSHFYFRCVNRRHAKVSFSSHNNQWVSFFLGPLEANWNYWVLIAANIITTHTTVF